MIVGDQIARAVRRFPDATAVSCEGASLTFRGLDERVTRLANGLLTHGLAKGDRVLSLLENSIECVEVDFALAKTGLVRVSLNPRCTVKELSYIVADSGARALIGGPTFDAVLGEVADILPAYLLRTGEGGSYEALIAGSAMTPIEMSFDAEHLYCLFYTSGTTGKPKGVMLSHRAILQIAFNLLMDVGPAQTGEKILLVQPMSHGAGFFVLPWFVRGGKSIIMREFDADEMLRIMRDEEVETVKLIPTMIQRLLRAEGAFPVNLPKLKRLIYGASPMPTPVLREAIEKFGRKLIQIYGQSEAAVTITTLSAEDHDLDGPDAQRLSSAGIPFSTVSIGVVDETGMLLPPGEAGEVVVRAPHLMSGYWNLPDRSAQTVREGWLHTSDYGRLDEHGYLYLLGRKDEMIISGGYNIAPFEVEEALYLHPAIQEAAVVGEPDPEWGSAVTAYVALRYPVSQEDIESFLKPHLGFKRPKRIYVLDELPKNSNGKIQKSALVPGLARPRA